MLRRNHLDVALAQDVHELGSRGEPGRGSVVFSLNPSLDVVDPLDNRPVTAVRRLIRIVEGVAAVGDSDALAVGLASEPDSGRIPALARPRLPHQHPEYQPNQHHEQRDQRPSPQTTLFRHHGQRLPCRQRNPAPLEEAVAITVRPRA